MLKIGSTEITKIFLGSNELEKAYLGSTIIYEKSTPTTTATISVTAGTGISSVTGAGEYTIGTNASVEATVASGYQFKHWAESSTPGTSVSTDNPYTFTVTDDRDLTAIGDSLSPVIPNDEIWYTTTDGKALGMTAAAFTGGTFVSDIYSNGKGIIKFNGNVTGIADSGFENKTSLVTIEFPESLVNYGKICFKGCTGLTSTTFHASTITTTATSTGSSNTPFYNLSGLTVTLSDNVANVNGYMWGNTKVLCMYSYPTTPPVLQYSGTLPGTSNVSAIYVPASAVDTYKSATTWASYKAKISAIS